MAPKCGVCHNEESKYKCPICELRYCSLTCYKSHKPTHDTQNDNLIETAVPAQPKRDRPGTTQRVPRVDFTSFENDKVLKRLLTRYPSLTFQLQAIYGLTLEPGPDEARTWNRQPLPGSYLPPGRGGRGRGRGRGRGGGGRIEASDERQHGPWTQEKGDKEALQVIKRMRDGRDGDNGEGLREFVELCRMRFGGDGVTEGELK